MMAMFLMSMMSLSQQTVTIHRKLSQSGSAMRNPPRPLVGGMRFAVPP
jgi:hypothetical protein